MYPNFSSKSTGLSTDRPLKRARKVQSCARCRRRKIKCDLDGQGASCSKCRQARVDCTMWDDDYEDPKKLAPPRLPRLSLASTQSLALSAPGSPDSFNQCRDPESRGSPFCETPFVARCEGLDLLSQASFTAIALEREEESKVGTPETPAFFDAADNASRPRLHGRTKSPRLSVAQSKPILSMPANGPLAALISASMQTRILAGIPSCTDLVSNSLAHCTPRRSRPHQPLNALDWFGAYHSAGYDVYALRTLEELGCFDLPCDDVIESVIGTYWERVHPAFPLLEATDFEEELWGGERPNLPSLALIWAVLLAGARHSTDHFVVEHVFGVRGTCSQFHARASALFDLDRNVPVMSKIQAGLLLGLYGEGDKTVEHIATAIRIAQRERLGECDSTHPNRALSRRVWWSAVAADRYVAAIEGMAPIIAEDEIDLDVCLTLEDFTDEDDPNVFPVSSEQLHLSLLLGRALVSRSADADLILRAEAQNFATQLSSGVGGWFDVMAFYHLAITAYICDLNGDSRDCSDMVSLVSSLSSSPVNSVYGPFAVWAMESALVATVKESAIAVMDGSTNPEAEEGRERCHVLVEGLRTLSNMWWGAEAKCRLAEVLKSGFSKTASGQASAPMSSSPSLCGEDSYDAPPVYVNRKPAAKCSPIVRSAPAALSDGCRSVSSHPTMGALGLTGVPCVV